MPNIKISDLPVAALPLDGAATFFEVQAVEAGIQVSRKVSVDDFVSGGIGLDATFVTVTGNAILPNERVLTAGTNVGLVDAGAGNPITINVTMALADLTDVVLAGAADNDLLFRVGGIWEDTAGLLTWDGAQLLVPQANTPLAPTIAFGDGDTGFYEVGDDQIQMAHAGVVTLVFRSDFFTYSGSGVPMFMNETASDTNPTLVPSNLAASSGLGAIGGAFSAPVIISQGIEAQRWLRTTALPGVITSSQANVGLTAHVGSSQGDGVIESSYNVYSTVANAGDAATLPSVFKVGQRIHIKNDGANSMDVFPASGDDLGAGVNTAVAVSAGDSKTFIGTAADTTWTELLSVIIPAVPAPEKLVDPAANDAMVAEGLGIVAMRSVGNIDAEDRSIEWQHQDGTTQFSIGNEFFTDMILRNHITGRHIIARVGIGGGNAIRMHLSGDQTNGGAALYAGSSPTPRFQTRTDGAQVGNGTLFLVEQAAQELDVASEGQLWVNSADDSLNYVTEAGVVFNLSAGVFDPTANQTITGDWTFDNAAFDVKFGVSTSLHFRNNADDSATFIQNLGPTFQFGIAGADFGDGIFEISQSSFAKVVCPPLFIGEQAAAEVDVTGDGQVWVRSDVSRQALVFTNEDGEEYDISPQSEAYKVAQTNRNTTIVLADDPNLVGFQLEASTAYMVEGWISGDQNVGGFRCAFTVSGASSEFTVTYAGVDSAGNEISLHRNSATQGALFAGFADPSTFGITIRGAIVTTGAVTVDFQWAQETSSANDTGVDEGSWIRFTRIRVQP